MTDEQFIAKPFIDKQALIDLLNNNLPEKSVISEISQQSSKISIISSVLGIINSGQLDVIIKVPQESPNPADNDSNTYKLSDVEKYKLKHKGRKKTKIKQ